MFYWLFLIVALGFFIWSLLDSGWELMSPVPLMLLGFAIADILAIVGRLTWNEYDMSGQIFLIETLGVVCLFLGYYLAKRAHEKRISAKHEPKHAKPSRVSGMVAMKNNPALWKWAVLGCIVLLAICLRITETYQLASELGKDTSSYSAAAKAVRQAYAAFNSSDGMQMGEGFSLVCRQLSKVVSVIAYVSLFVLARSIVAKEWKTIAASAIVFVACCVNVFVSGGRGDLFYYTFAFVFFFFFCEVKNGKNARRLCLQILGVGAVCAVVGSFLFWASSSLVGRKSSSGLVEYISFYFGCGFPSLQALQDSEANLNTTPGTLAFYYVMAIPYKFFHLGSSYPSYSISWFDMGGHRCNIFTGFARYYLDFGFLGLVVLSSASAFLMTYFCGTAKKRNSAYLMIVAGYISANAFDFAREEFLFSRFCSTTTIVWLIILAIILMFLTLNAQDVKNLKSQAKTKESILSNS